MVNGWSHAAIPRPLRGPHIFEGACLFLGPNFLLESDAARTLYHGYAAREPILDYHCHLPPEQIASDHRFADLAEVWLAG